MTSSLNAGLNAMELDDESESIHDDEVLDADNADAASSANADNADSEETVSIADEDTDTEDEDAPSGDGNETSEDEEGVLPSESSDEEDAETDAETDDDRMSASATEEDPDADANADAVAGPSAPNRRKRKNPRRWLQQVQKAQATYNLLLPEAPFRRLVREIGEDFKTDLRFTAEAFLALQEVSESYLIETFDMSNIMAIHRGVITIQPKDMQVARMVGNKFKWNV